MKGFLVARERHGSISGPTRRYLQHDVDDDDDDDDNDEDDDSEVLDLDFRFRLVVGFGPLQSRCT